MKTLSNYKGNDAIELWADLLDPLSRIFTDGNIAKVVRSGQSKLAIAKAIIKDHSQDAVEILTRIDDTPIDGLNVITRLVGLITEIGQDETVKSFFGFAAEQTKESSGLPTENIGANES